MMESVPILKGETAKINLEIAKYKETQIIESTEINHSSEDSNSNQLSNEDLDVQNSYNDNIQPDQHQYESRTDFLMSQDLSFEQINDQLDKLDEEDETDGVRNEFQPDVDSSFDPSTYDSPPHQMKYIRNTHTNNHHDRSHSYQGNAKEWSQNDQRSILAKQNAFYDYSRYKRDSNSWVTESTTYDPYNVLLTKAKTFKSPKEKPKQIIPKVDASVPLAKRHSVIIAQCKLNLSHYINQLSECY